jgi:hypothetical protein
VDAQSHLTTSTKSNESAPLAFEPLTLLAFAAASVRSGTAALIDAASWLRIRSSSLSACARANGGRRKAAGDAAAAAARGVATGGSSDGTDGQTGGVEWSGVECLDAKHLRQAVEVEENLHSAAVQFLSAQAEAKQRQSACAAIPPHPIGSE